MSLQKVAASNWVWSDWDNYEIVLPSGRTVQVHVKDTLWGMDEVGTDFRSGDDMEALGNALLRLARQLKFPQGITALQGVHQ